MLRERNLQAQSYRLHLVVLTNNAVIRQFYSPLSTSVEPISPPQSEFSYGGGGGYRTLVLPVIRFVSTNYVLFIPDYSSVVKSIIQNLLQHPTAIFFYLQDVLLKFHL